MSKRNLDIKVRVYGHNQATNKLKPQWSGGLIPFMDEALVTGSPQFNAATLICDVEEDDYWVITITTEKEHSVWEGVNVVEISESSVLEYNGVFRVQEVISATSFTIALDKKVVTNKPGNDMNGAKWKIAPLGYRKVFSGEDKAVYTSGDPSVNKCFLRVDATKPSNIITNDGVKFARVSIYSDMTHIDDYLPKIGVLKAPYDPSSPVKAEVESGVGEDAFTGWSKWYWHSYGTYHIKETENALSSVPLNWVFIGDDRTFYISSSHNNNRYYSMYALYAYGEYDNRVFSTSHNHLLVCHEKGTQVKEDSNFLNNNRNPGGSEGGNVMTRKGYSEGKFLLNNLLLSDVSGKSSSFYLSSSGTVETGGGSGSGATSAYNVVSKVLNIVPTYLTAVYGHVSIRVGGMRGFYWCDNNFREGRTDVLPDAWKVIKDFRGAPDAFFYLTSIFMTWGNSRDFSLDSRVAFSMRDWR